VTKIGGVTCDAAIFHFWRTKMSISTMVYMVLASCASCGCGYILAWALDEMRVRN